jgi:hypothetical protein
MRKIKFKRVMALIMCIIMLGTQIAYAENNQAAKLSIEEISVYDKSVVIIYSLDRNGDVIAQGSGFCVGEGVFITNFHVIEDAAKLELETEDNETFQIEGIVSADMESDLVLLKTKENPNLAPLKLGFGKKLTKGQKVITIGSPIGLKNTVSDGIISGFRNNSSTELIQISAPITHGSSGSPLFDAYGDVIGVNTSGMDTGSLNFAVSINHIASWTDRIKGMIFSQIPLIGKENYTKDTKIKDSEITNVLTNMCNLYNSENLKAYMNLFYFSNNTVRNSVSNTLTSQFKKIDVKIQLKDIKIIKKTENETLVRAVTSYNEKNKNRGYNDNTVRALYYLKKVGRQWMIYKVDSEWLLSIKRYYNTDDEDGNTPAKNEQDTESKVIVVKPGTSTNKEDDLSGDNSSGSASVKPINIKASDVKEIDVSVSIDNVKYNKSNNKIYALNKVNKKLIIIDAASKKVEKRISLKYIPSDFCLSTDNSMLYIVNEGSNNIVEIRLNDFTTMREFIWDAPSYQNDNVHYHIKYNDKKLYLVDGKWAPSLWVLDLKSLNITDYGQGNNDNDLAGDKIDNVGDFCINEKTGDIYFWQQYGWSAGYAGSDVFRYEQIESGFNQIDRAGLSYPGYKRDPLDTPIIIVEKKKWIVSKNYVLNMENLKQKYYKFDEDLYAVDFNGTYAVSKKSIYNMDAFVKVGKVPLENANFYLFDSSGTLYMVDNSKSKIKYCVIK